MSAMTPVQSFNDAVESAKELDSSNDAKDLLWKNGMENGPGFEIISLLQSNDFRIIHKTAFDGMKALAATENKAAADRYWNEGREAALRVVLNWREATGDTAEKIMFDEMAQDIDALTRR